MIEEIERGEKRNLEWRCLTCGATALPTSAGYMGFIPHKCTGKKEIWLVDKDTGEQLANNANKAVQLGLIPKKVEKGKEGEIEVSSEGILTYFISLPADAFTLFNLAKFSGLEKDGGKPFDEWVWDCIRKRFETDYKCQLVLAPIAEV